MQFTGVWNRSQTKVFERAGFDLFTPKNSAAIYSIPIKESMSVCNANKLLLFGGVFTTPPISPCYRITTVHVRHALHIRWLYALGGLVHGCGAS